MAAPSSDQLGNVESLRLETAGGADLILSSLSEQIQRLEVVGDSGNNRIELPSQNPDGDLPAREVVIQLSDGKDVIVLPEGLKSGTSDVDVRLIRSEVSGDVVWSDSNYFDGRLQWSEDSYTDLDLEDHHDRVQIELSGDDLANQFAFTDATVRVVLSGGGGNDTLIGGKMSDRLIGGQGSDTVTGGGAPTGHSDTYVIQGEGRRIELAAADGFSTKFDAKVEAADTRHASVSFSTGLSLKDAAHIQFVLTGDGASGEVASSAVLKASRTSDEIKNNKALLLGRLEADLVAALASIPA